MIRTGASALLVSLAACVALCLATCVAGCGTGAKACLVVDTTKTIVEAAEKACLVVKYLAPDGMHEERVPPAELARVAERARASRLGVPMQQVGAPDGCRLPPRMAPRAA